LDEFGPAIFFLPTYIVDFRLQMHFSILDQGFQIFLGATYQNGEKLFIPVNLKYTKWPPNTPNSHEMGQIDI
jgi:hypothetical protein